MNGCKKARSDLWACNQPTALGTGVSICQPPGGKPAQASRIQRAQWFSDIVTIDGFCHHGIAAEKKGTNKRWDSPGTRLLTPGRQYSALRGDSVRGIKANVSQLLKSEMAARQKENASKIRLVYHQLGWILKTGLSICQSSGGEAQASRTQEPVVQFDFEEIVLSSYPWRLDGLKPPGKV